MFCIRIQQFPNVDNPQNYVCLIKNKILLVIIDVSSLLMDTYRIQSVDFSLEQIVIFYSLVCSNLFLIMDGVR